MIRDKTYVSIVVRNYNQAQFLGKRLRSFLKQKYQYFELIVLEDASTDDSLSIIETTPTDRPYKLITNNQNSGSPCRQWFRGIAEARRTFIWLAESDDS
jgi:glycosyltransferase involved in cell wall biosynthesis